MSSLNGDQFEKVSSQMDAMDQAYPTPHASTSGPFFHGTTHNIKDGVVRPAHAVGKNASEYSMGDPGDMSEGDHAFVTKDEDYAWHAANTFHPNGRRPRVYQTEGATDMKPGPWNKDHPDFLHHVEYGDPKEYPPHENPEAHAEALSNHQPEFGSPTGFKVRDRIDIMPGRQGTFPEVNWNTYRATDFWDGDGPRAPRNTDERNVAMLGWGNDTNHPTNHEVNTSQQGRAEQDKFEHVKRTTPPAAKSLREFMDAPQGKLSPPPKKDKGQLPLF